MIERDGAGAEPLAHVGGMHQLLAQAQRRGVAVGQLLDPAWTRLFAAGRVPDYIPAIVLIDALERAADLPGCATIGLETSLGADLHGFGPLSALTGHCTSVADALAQSDRYMHLVNGALTTRVDRYDAIVRVERISILPGARGNRQMMDAATLMLVRAMRGVLGAEWSPRRVEIAHGGTPARIVYQRAFRAPLAFDADHYAVELTAADFDRIVPLESPARRQAFDRALADLARRYPGELALRVRQKVRQRLGEGRVSLGWVAGALDRPARSLQRQLRGQGSDFTTILRDQRIAVAEEYLAAEPRPSLTELASRLSFEDVSVASRFVRDQLGTGFRARRSAVRSAPAAAQA